MNRKIYGSANDIAKTIKKIYGGVQERHLDSVTGVIAPGGAGYVTGFIPTIFVNAVEGKINNSKTLKFVQTVRYEDGGIHANTFLLLVAYTDFTYHYLEEYVPRSTITDYGIITDEVLYGGTERIDLTPVYSTPNVAKEITKLYGSVGGDTKLIYQNFGHISYT